jgi:N-acetylmuramoyl-L-alanine amidase
LNKIIVIDAGHGGTDFGASGFNLHEKDINLDIALQLKTLLANYADVRLTRYTDIFISLTERATLANSAKADLFVSIHVNAGGGTGFESYLRNNANKENISMGEMIHKVMADFYATKGFPDRGMKNANFAVLRETTMPAILLENLFIDHQKDAESLANSSFRKEIATAISSGIIKLLDLAKPITTPPPSLQDWALPDFIRLLNEGLVKDQHDLNSMVTWGELSAIISRLLDKLKK